MSKSRSHFGQIEARKIYGKLNNADLLHTKPLRSPAFKIMANKILGNLPSLPPPDPSIIILAQEAEIMSSSVTDMDATVAPSRGLKRNRSDTPEKVAHSGAKRRKAHVLKYITSPAMGSTSET